MVLSEIRSTQAQFLITSYLYNSMKRSWLVEILGRITAVKHDRLKNKLMSADGFQRLNI